MNGPNVELGQESDACFTVFVDGEDVGFGSIEPDNSAFAFMRPSLFRATTRPQNSARIMFRLWPAHRGYGLGEAVVRLVIDRAFQRDYTRVWLGLVDAPRHAAAQYVAGKVGMREFHPHALPDWCIGLELRRDEWARQSRPQVTERGV